MSIRVLVFSYSTRISYLELARLVHRPFSPFPPFTQRPHPASVSLAVPTSQNEYYTRVYFVSALKGTSKVLSDPASTEDAVDEMCGVQ